MTHDTSRHRRATRRSRALLLAGFCTMNLIWAVAPSPAGATVSSVSGGAFGWKTSVSLFGGPTMVRGTDAGDAVVDLPSSGSLTPVVDFAASGVGQYGPAKIYSGGPIAVSTSGHTGDALRAAEVVSTATATNVGTYSGVMLEDNTGQYVQPLGGEMDPFIAAKVTSTCRVTESGTPEGSTTIVGGRTVSTDANGDPTDPHDVDLQPVANGGWVTGELAHVGDEWRIRYNEQITNADGSLTVNAVHMELLGPIAVGHMYIGQSRCGYTD